MRRPCDLLLTNALVVTMDEQFSVHAPGSIAITGSGILAVGDIAGDFDAVETVDCRGRVVMPGLINAHTHAPMTLLRGLADDLRLDVWLMGYMMPVEREFVHPEFVALGTQLACAEMIRSGTTCFADMYYFEDAVAEATASAGLRALCAQTVLKFPTPDAASYEDALAVGARVHREMEGASADRPLRGPPRAVHVHRRDLPRVCGAGMLNSTCRCTRIWRKRRSRSNARARNTACRSSHGRKSSGSSMRASWRRTASTWTREKSGHCATHTPGLPTTPPAI